MTPTVNRRFPYSQIDVAKVTGLSVPQIKKLSTQVLRKKGTGKGNPLGYNLDDKLHLSIARELLKAGVDVSSIYSLFAALDKPQVASARPWSWLRTPDRIHQGAALVLLLAPRNAPIRSGAAYLTTAAEAVRQLKQTTQTVIVIDVGAIIYDLEQQTGETYTEQSSSSRT